MNELVNELKQQNTSHKKEHLARMKILTYQKDVKKWTCTYLIKRLQYIKQELTEVEEKSTSPR